MKHLVFSLLICVTFLTQASASGLVEFDIYAPLSNNITTNREAVLNAPSGITDLNSPIQHIFPAQEYWNETRETRVSDVKPGMFIAVLENGAKVFLKKTMNDSIVGEILTHRFLECFEETQGFFLPTKVFQTELPNEAVNFYQLDPDSNPDNYFIFTGTPFLEGSETLADFLQNNFRLRPLVSNFFSTWYTKLTGGIPNNIYTLLLESREHLRYSALLQAVLGAGDDHFNNYLVHDGVLHMVDGESANRLTEEEFNELGDTIFNPLFTLRRLHSTLQAPAKALFFLHGEQSQSLVNQDNIYPQSFIEELHPFSNNHAWEELLNFTLPSGDSPLAYFDVDQASRRVDSILDRIQYEPND